MIMNKVQEMLVQMLKWIDFLEWVENDKILELSSFFQLKCIPANTTLIQEWIVPDKIYILKNWDLEVRKKNGFSVEKLANIEEWELFWEFSFFQQKAAVASVVAIDDSVDIWEVSKEEFKKFIDKYSEIKENIRNTMESRIEENKKKWWKNYENDYYCAGMTGEEVNVELNFEINL